MRFNLIYINKIQYKFMNMYYSIVNTALLKHNTKQYHK